MRRMRKEMKRERVGNFLQPRVKLEKTTFRPLSLSLLFLPFCWTILLTLWALSDGLKLSYLRKIEVRVNLKEPERELEEIEKGRKGSSKVNVLRFHWWRKTRLER